MKYSMNQNSAGFNSVEDQVVGDYKIAIAQFGEFFLARNSADPWMS